MRGYSAEKVFSPRAQIMRGRAAEIVTILPEGLRCHEVARIIHIKLDNVGIVVDGHYGMVDHTWLVIPNYTDSEVILDCYTVGRLPPVQLVTMDVGLGVDYRPGPERTDIKFSTIRRIVNGDYSAEEDQG